MNLILFERSEIDPPRLLARDPRARHVLDVLRRKPGDQFDVGLIDGPRGKATLLHVAAEELRLEFAWGSAPPALDPITLLVAVPRPQTARKILQDATALGAGTLKFFRAEKSEPSYAQSTLWSSGEWRRHLLAGAEQAFDTRLPVVSHSLSLDACLGEIDSTARASPSLRVALDNYESPHPLSALATAAESVLAFGPERGWSARERDALRKHGFQLAHLGSRVLRTETAVVAALAIVKAKLGKM